MFPNYIDVKLQAYFEMSSEDRRKILDERYFDTNPLTCPALYLPYLALEVGVNIDGLSEKEARIAINEAINALNYKGTAKSFKSSLKPYTDAKVKEWYEYDGEPYYFKAVLSPTNVDFKFNDENFKRIKNVINENKNVRSVLDGFEFDLTLKEELKTYGAVTLKPKINKDLNIDLKGKSNSNLSSGAVYEARINKDALLDLTLNEKVTASEANIFYLSINKNLQKDLKPTENLTFTQGAISDVSINSTLSLDLEHTNNNTIQGAVIWRV